MRLALSAACAGLSLAAAAAPLFESGRSEWTVVVPDGAPRPVAYAAEELVSTVGKISGARLASVTSSGTVPQGNVIRLVCTGTSLEDEFSVSVSSDEIVLSGNSPRATLFAAYAFLRDCLDARWYWPGEDGEFLPKLERWEPVSWRRTYRPAFSSREMSITGIWRHRHEPTERWMAKVFLNTEVETPSVQEDLGFIYRASGHEIGLPATLAEREKIFAEHPDWFALVNGVRTVDGQAGCWSNEGFFRYVVDKLAAKLRARHADIANFYIADVPSRCECAGCTSDPDRSARFWNFYARIIEELRKEFPEQRFAGLAYQEYRTIPGVPVKYVDYVDYCHYNRCYFHKLDDPDCAYNVASMAEYRNWAARTPVGLYGYEFDVFRHRLYLPMMQVIADEMRVFRDMGLVRVKTELSVDLDELTAKRPTPRHGVSQLANRLSNYLWATFAFDPDADLDAVLQDFCRHVYGSGANGMAAYHALMARAWSGMPTHITYFLKDEKATARAMITPEVERLARGHLVAAAEATAGEPRAHDQVMLDIECFNNWLWSARGGGMASMVVESPLDNRGMEEPVLVARRDAVDIPYAGDWFDAGSCDLYVDGALCGRSDGPLETETLTGARDGGTTYALRLVSASETLERLLMVFPANGTSRLVHTLETDACKLNARGDGGFTVILR